MRLFLLSLCVVQSLAALTLTKLSYTRLPYRNIQSPTTSDYAMFQDAAYKAAYHTLDRLLYVAYVAACPDTIAVSLSHVVPTQEGHVELFKPFNRNTKMMELSGRYTVGSYPKSMAFNSDCTRLVVVNEGPAGLDANNNFVDPEGSLNIFVRNDNGFPIDVPMNFMQYNSRYEEYLAKGVRYVYRGDHSSNPPKVNTFSQDLEPEAVTISSDDRFAFVSLMENNAMAKIDLINLRIEDIYPLGVKNWTSYDIDASDSNRAYFPGRYNIYSFYQPGDLSFGVVNGVGYVISADTGSPKTYTTAANGVAFSDNARGRSAKQNRMNLVIFSLCVAQSLAALTLTKLSYTRLPFQNFQSPTANDYAMFTDSAYKAAYQAVDNLLYVASGNDQKNLHVWDLNNPSKPVLLHTKTFNDKQDGRITNVAVCPDTLAVSLAHKTPTEEGHVEIFKTYNRNTRQLESNGRYTVGSYPKAMAFNNECTRLVIANEGPPGMDKDNTTFVDPEGSVTILMRNDNGFPIEVPMNFRQFNDRSEEYVAKGVRYIYRGNHTINPPIVNTFSRDLEPEAVTLSNDDRYAFISLMENNAIAKIDLINLRIMDIYPLGVKNWTSYNIDADNQNKAYFPGRYNIYSFYQPGDLAFGVVNGVGYIISADTGSPKTLTDDVHGVNFADNTRGLMAKSNLLIDPTLVSSNLQAALDSNKPLGNVLLSTLEKSCYHGLIDNLYLFGGRGFSLWDSTNMNHVFESGEDLEKRGAEAYPSTFNGECSNTKSSPSNEADQRSDDMGPEPNSLALGTIANEPVLFVGTRTGLVYTYAMRGISATFQSVYRDGLTSSSWQNLYNSDNAGNAIISDIGFISANHSSTKTPLLYVISRGSGSIGIYEVTGTVQ
ncbi:hypothetical protein FSP39_001143 [Pinctada imbricata]|uniref:Choice-of-anchor I domain-containing protein n=1 Tax=Pinctada imbricata TaxID=66713 RepID=A0AA89C294_PINIB|nr:hypothetical protein FSP39_001143 [Pinctada imbricata]